MKQLSAFSFLLIVGLQYSCSSGQTEILDYTTLEFLDLLVTDKEVSVREWRRLKGQSHEEINRDLDFEVAECEVRGWISYPEDVDEGSETQECRDFINARYSSEDVESLYIAWLKKRFSTVGKKYKVISKSHGDIDVLIGDHIFSLNRCLDVHCNDIAVRRVDGREESSYYPESVHRWLKRGWYYAL